MTREETNLTHTKHTSTRRETTFHGNSVYRSVRHEHIFITNSFCGVHKSRLSSFIWAVWLSGLSLPYATTQTHTVAIHTNRASYQTQAGSYFGFLYHIFFSSSCASCWTTLMPLYRLGTKGTILSFGYFGRNVLRTFFFLLLHCFCNAQLPLRYAAIHLYVRCVIFHRTNNTKNWSKWRKKKFQRKT